MLKYKFAPYPKDQYIDSTIQSAVTRLLEKLKNIDLEKLHVSDYIKSYFNRYLSKLPHSLLIPSYLFYWVLDGCDLPINEIVLVDYGGGTGLLSLLAKEAGVGTVIYDDIFDESCKNAYIIGKSLGIEADHYVNADIDGLITYIKKQSLFCNAVVSYDVLEHIYDIEGFLKKIKYLSEGDLQIALASGANKYNPMINYTIRKFHKLVEFQDRQPTLKSRDSYRSYLSVRREIIKKNVPQLSNAEVEELAKRTRGLCELDIVSKVSQYIQTGVKPEILEHSTNTCDPYTGNWAEHLMDINRLVKILQQESFSIRLLYGYYGNNKIVKAIIGMILNFGIRILGKCGLMLAPYFILNGRLKSEE